MEITTPPSSSQHYVLNTKEAVSKGPNSILRHNIANEMISFQKIDSQFCHGLASKQSLSTAFNYISDGCRMYKNNEGVLSLRTNMVIKSSKNKIPMAYWWHDDGSKMVR